MQNVFTDYPDVPWKQGWRFFFGPEDHTPFITGTLPGTLTAPGADWTLHLIEPSSSCTARLFCNGFSISARWRPEKHRIDALVTESGVLCGVCLGLPAPDLTAAVPLNGTGNLVWVQNDHKIALLLRQENRFAFVNGGLSQERALAKAEAVLDENFESLMQRETEARQNISALFGMNPRHNPPVALAAELLKTRLRERTGAIHGLWSVADGFETEAFSLNELYPLVRAWTLIDPPVALKLTQTALALQQNNGGFPAWVDTGGIVSPTAPWPLIAQSFELAWQSSRDPALLKKYLPALRKYVQWAVRRFDPHRDHIPAWQNEQEVFIPGVYERGKATPELTVLLIAEIEAVLRLCEESEHAEAAAESLNEERNHLTQTLNTVFWNPVVKAFSNVWKDGHYLHEPSFGSFLPLFWRGLDSEKRTALLEAFEETRAFPGHQDPENWKQEQMNDSARLPAIHQFMALETFRNADGADALLMLFVRRAREGLAVWLERESIEAEQLAERGETTDAPAYALGPVMAALVLAVQYEFQKQTAKNSSAAQQIMRWIHRLSFNPTDLRLVAVFSLAILIAHLAYTLSHSRDDEQTRTAEAVLSYKQAHFTETMRICRRYPHNALSQFLQANLLMLAERPEEAAGLYRKALLQETESPSALLGLALTLQMNGNFEEAVKRYSDFLDIYETRYPEAAELADEFMQMAREKFSKPPRWRRVYALPVMNDLGL